MPTVFSSSQDGDHPSSSDQITMPGLLPKTMKHWILLTYQPVIVTIFLVVAVAKWYSRRERSRHKARATVGENREDPEAISRCEKTDIVLEAGRSSRSISCNGARG
jgi:hypothetical protein